METSHSVSTVFKLSCRVSGRSKEVLTRKRVVGRVSEVPKSYEMSERYPGVQVLQSNENLSTKRLVLLCK